jgi:hypothetical protein
MCAMLNPNRLRAGIYTTKRTTMIQPTYTIARLPHTLLSCRPDGHDYLIECDIAAAAQTLDIRRADVIIEKGLTLTNDVADDESPNWADAWSVYDHAELIDHHGATFAYAIRREPQHA